jgi:hypothetical protein
MSFLKLLLSSLFHLPKQNNQKPTLFTTFPGIVFLFMQEI